MDNELYGLLNKYITPWGYDNDLLKNSNDICSNENKITVEFTCNDKYNKTKAQENLEMEEFNKKKEKLKKCDNMEIELNNLKRGKKTGIWETISGYFIKEKESIETFSNQSDNLFYFISLFLIMYCLINYKNLI